MQRISLVALFAALLCGCAPTRPTPTETNGLLVVEAEAFDRQLLDGVRRWYVVRAGSELEPMADADPSHAEAASGHAYLEILPDTRTNHDEALIRGENFTNKGGMMAILEYDIRITHPGRYYVWASAFSTGTEDNGIHVGLDGKWPLSGERMQWCDGKHTWTWASNQRTQEVPCGVPGLIYLDIDTPGPHVVQFSMREDGFEFDRWALTSDPLFDPAKLP